MAVLSYREVLPRTFTHRFGESPSAERKFVVTTDGAESHQTLLDAVGIYHGTTHPEFSYLLCLEGSITETDRFHAEITYRYGTPATGTSEAAANPLSRADVWSFSTGGAAVPALGYYHPGTAGSGNGEVRALVNSAGDFFEGLQSEEAEVRATISGNRASFPLADAVAVTNCVNNGSYLGGAAHQWKCSGIAGQQQIEVVGGAEVKYWSVTAELVYRQSGWNLYIPNVGYNFIESSERKRCFVIHEGEKIPSSNPIALTDSGGMRLANDLATSGRPTILNRRIYKEINFSTYFGTPPF